MNKAVSIKENFSGDSQILTVNETASTAIAEQAKAMVESRYIMAMRNPRNWDQVRSDLLKECKRPRFANNQSAYYVKPIGKGVEGLGIRFVEVALRCMKNVLIETSMIFEDSNKELHRVTVTDLESNITYPLDVKVTKTVQRSKPNDDGSFISVKNNSRGYKTYTIEAQDDDLLNKRGAMISKAVRTLGLRIIPGDLCDEAEDIIKSIRLNSAAQDPEAERKKVVDAFSGLGVSANNLVDYLGHPIEQCSPHQLVDLRGLYGAIKDGEASWKTVMENKKDQDNNVDSEGLTVLISSIHKSKSIEELNKLTAEAEKFSGADLKAVRVAWSEKLKELKPEKEPVNNEEAIKACKNADELTELLKTISGVDQMELTDIVDDRFDDFR